MKILTAMQELVADFFLFRRDQVNLLVYGPDWPYFKQKQKILESFDQLAFLKSMIFCVLKIKRKRNET